MTDLKDRVMEVLELHRYSPSPWNCSCGHELVNANLFAHVADRIVGILP